MVNFVSRRCGAHNTDRVFTCKPLLLKNFILCAVLTWTVVSRFNRHMANRICVDKVNYL
ncbi:hypothetical protein PSEUDO9AZ_11228 [Pseudomonas sp. 9AZ]|nr:hypothetical protein PSEUDO9AZ_11228 [Pseudomonas sp. 9AZ]